MAPDIVAFVTLLLGMAAGYLLACDRVRRMKNRIAFYEQQNAQLHVVVDAIKQGRVREV